MKPYTENEMRQIRRVYGEDVTFDENNEPQERGIGSPSQSRPNPTSKPSNAPRPEQLVFLHKMVAAAGSAELVRDFARFMAWRKAHPADCILEMPIELLATNPAHPGLDQQKLHQFRGRLRNGDIAPPVLIKDKNAEGQYLILDGHTRVAAARDEGRKFVRSRIVKETDPRKDRGERAHNEQSESW